MASEAAASEASFDHLGLRDRVLTLRSLGPLEALDNDALAIIAEHAQPRKFAQGEYLLRYGEPVREVHIITEGLVRVTQGKRLVAVVDRGFGVGFVSTLSRDPDGVDAIATLPTCSLAMPVQVLLDAFEENFSILRNGLRLSAAQVLRARGGLPSTDRDQEPDIGVYPERPRTFVERVIEIRKGVLFAPANLDASIEFVRRSTEVRGVAGDVFWNVGDPSRHWFHVEYGRVRCTNATGESTVVGAGFVLGVMEALGLVPRHFSAVAETDYVIYRTELETMLAICEAHFSLAMDLQANLSRTVLHLNAGVADDQGSEGGD